MNSRASAFLDDGCCVVAGVAPASLLERLRAAVRELLAGEPSASRERYRFHGSMIRVPYWRNAFASLIALEPALAALAGMGCSGIKWISGYVISKPAGGPALWWHQDWWAWDEPCSAAPIPPQIFLMYYLQDTDESNGCLRVIPGSHRRRVDLHAQLPEAHSDAVSDSPVAFSRHAGEVPVPVRAGDVVVGDARVLHATHANSSARERTCLTLWYAPRFASLPAAIRVKMAAQRGTPPAGAEPEALRRLRGLLPKQRRAQDPGPYNRTPGHHLEA